MSTATRVKIPTVIMSKNINVVSLKIFPVTFLTTFIQQQLCQEDSVIPPHHKRSERVDWKEEKVVPPMRQHFSSFVPDMYPNG